MKSNIEYLQELKFLSIEVYKNGSYKIHFIECELYQTLYSLGYRFVRIDRKPFIYHVESDTKVRLVKHIQELRDTFSDYVKKLPVPVENIAEILNAFYARKPLKSYGLMEHYLSETSEPTFWLRNEIRKLRELI